MQEIASCCANLKKVCKTGSPVNTKKINCGKAFSAGMQNQCGIDQADSRLRRKACAHKLCQKLCRHTAFSVGIRTAPHSIAQKQTAFSAWERKLCGIVAACTIRIFCCLPMRNKKPDVILCHKRKIRFLLLNPHRRAENVRCDFLQQLCIHFFCRFYVNFGIVVKIHSFRDEDK